MPRETCVLDIETVPDAGAARRALDEEGLTDAEAVERLRAQALEKTGGRSDFLHPVFHRVVAISYAWLRHERAEEGGGELVLDTIRSAGRPDDDEKALLAGFFGMIEKRRPRLVTFNGRGFDLPVLKLRAMAHGLSCPAWFSAGDKPWQGYTKRYDLDFHLDLMEALTDFGAIGRMRLHEVAAVFGVPGKLGTSGEDVEALVAAGRIEEVRAYCETDVCTTLLVFLRWARFTGELGEGAWARALEGLRNHLEAEREARPHLGAFLDAWRALAAA